MDRCALSTKRDAVEEVLGGARDESHLDSLSGLLARASSLLAEPGDCERAASLYRVCRHRAETIRRPIDCLIAAIALRAQVPVLRADADLRVLARHTALRMDEPWTRAGAGRVAVPALT